MKKYLMSWPLLMLTAMITGCSSTGHKYDLHKTLALVIILAIIAMFFVLAFYTNMLRDEVNDCDNFEAETEKIRQKRRLKFFKSNNPFSLSRVQLGVWTVVISCSYIYLELCLGNCDTTGINETALVLMGISAAVTTGGTLIDKKEIQDGRDRHQNTPSEGFFADILSDDNGISIHRFQNVVWTGIAIIIYLNKVYSTTKGCILPELSETLLLLTGISSATYLTLKSQENNPAIDSPAAAPAPDAVVVAQVPAPTPAFQQVVAPQGAPVPVVPPTATDQSPAVVTGDAGSANIAAPPAQPPV